MNHTDRWEWRGLAAVGGCIGVSSFFFKILAGVASLFVVVPTPGLSTRSGLGQGVSTASRWSVKVLARGIRAMIGSASIASTARRVQIVPHFPSEHIAVSAIVRLAE